MGKFILVRGKLSGFVRVYEEELYPHFTTQAELHEVVATDLSEEEAVALATLANVNIKEYIRRKE